MRFSRFVFASLAAAAVVLTGLVPASAAGTTLFVLGPSNARGYMTEIIAMYQKAHPDVTVDAAYAGSQTILKNVESGGAVDAVIIGVHTLNPEAQKYLDSLTPLYTAHVVIATSRTALTMPHAVRITSARDLAKPGVRLAGGVPGSGPRIFEDQVYNGLGKLYGGDFEKKVRANIQVTKTDVAQIAAALDAGLVDAAPFLSADIDSKMDKVELPPDVQVTLTFSSATVKTAPHAAAARDFVAFLSSPAAMAAYKKHGFTTH